MSPVHSKVFLRIFRYGKLRRALQALHMSLLRKYYARKKTANIVYLSIWKDLSSPFSAQEGDLVNRCMVQSLVWTLYESFKDLQHNGKLSFPQYTSQKVNIIINSPELH